MSRQSKQRKKNALRNKAKGAHAGKHFHPNEKPSPFPSEQPKPVWVRPTGKKGWWNTRPKKDNEARASD